MRYIAPVFLLLTTVFTAGTLHGQALAINTSDVQSESSSLLASADLPSAPIPASAPVPVADISVPLAGAYVFPTQQERFHDYVWNAVAADRADGQVDLIETKRVRRNFLERKAA